LSLTLSGVVDIGYVAPAFVSEKLPLSAVAELPLNFATSCEGTEAYYKLAKNGIIAKQEFEPAGVRALFTFVVPPYQVFLRKKLELGAGSLTGLKIRTTGSAKELMLRAMGAVPVQIASPDVYQALSRGTIDGMLLARLRRKIATRVLASLLSTWLRLGYTSVRSSIWPANITSTK
jgi:TRAP-type C4-dicarboxylate transport system substrate-binding protein